MFRYVLVLIGAILFFVACGGRKKNTEIPDEGGKAKSMLQGIWIDDESDTPLMRIEGDTIYYTDPQIAPVCFRIAKDSLYLYGNETTSYHIMRQTDYSFWFQTIEDNVIKLHKSENPTDSLAFPQNNTVEAIPVYTEVTKRDSVVTHKGTRYRAYVYINPSKIKVVRTSYSDEGLSVDNVYYDNVMHICVYEGRTCLFDSDITRQMFAEVVPEEFLNQSILSDMNFVKVDDKGFHYKASVCAAGSSVCNMVDLLIDFDWKLTITAGK